MSLQLRLRLNNTLDNTGLVESVITNNGATVDTGGINGSCYAFNGSTSYIAISGIADCFKGGNNPFSISFWFYHTGNSRRGILFGNYGLVSKNIINLEITAANKLRFWWDGSPDWVLPNFTLTTQTWYHCVFVYDGSSVKLYINGELKDTRSGSLEAKTPSGKYQIGRDYRTGETAFYGKMNDFRVYDNALSVKEIKEIYNNSFLIAHYTFSDPYLFVQNNLVTKINVNNTILSQVDDHSFKILTVSGDAYCNFILSTTLSSSNKYVLSYWADIENGDKCGFGFYYSSKYNHIHYIKNGLNVVVFQPTTDLSSITFDDIDRANSHEIYIRNIKIEPYNASLGDISTPFGTQTNIISDCVGDYEGTITNQVLVLPINRKYKYCTKFTGTQYGIVNKQFEVTPKSFSFWASVDTKPTSNSIIFADGNSKFAFGFYNSGNQLVVGAGMSKYIVNLNNKFIFGIDAWNHVVVQGDPSSTTVNVYINGEKLTNTTTTHYWIHNQSKLYIGAGNNDSVNIFGQFSIQDLRVYSRILSEDEILEIIHIPINLDSKGTLFNSEINEMAYSGNIKFNKSGSIFTNNVIVENLTQKQASLTKLGEVKINRLIEK